MMKNLFFFSLVDIEQENKLGIYNKIRGQLNGFKSQGYNVNYAFFQGSEFLIYNENNINVYKKRYERHFTRRTCAKNSFLMDYIKKKKIDIIYIRYYLSDPFFISFLRELKRRNIKIYLEIPTFPFDKEINSKKLFFEKMFRRNLYKYVYKVVLSSDKIDTVFNIPTVFMGNGVDTDNLDFNKKIYKKEKKELNLIGVSFIRRTNGYDRLLKGLYNYYFNHENDKNVYITFVGEGTEKERLKDLSTSLNLNQYVKFVGNKTGKDLDELYDKADIAISSLGDHRASIYYKAPLKSREYSARGIPFISSVVDIGFDKDSPFLLKVEPNENPINISEIINFYYFLCEEKDISSEMRKYAKDNFDWSNKCKVIE